MSLYHEGLWRYRLLNVSWPTLTRDSGRRPCTLPVQNINRNIKQKLVTWVCVVLQVLQHFGEDPAKGLTERQVLEQRAIYGTNELVPDKGTPFWKLVLKQFDDLLVKILLLAAVVDLIIAIVNGETGFSVFVEPGVILLILVANGALVPPNG